MIHNEKRGFATNHPRGITERVEQFNRERMERKETGGLSVATYDVQDFFTNVPRRVFLADVQQARDRLRRRFGGANFF